MKAGIAILILVTVVAVAPTSSIAAATVSGGEPALMYLAELPQQYDLAVDVRSKAVCSEASLARAVCIPLSDVSGPHRRLPNWSGLLWLFGSAGLNGSESLLVIGDQPQARSYTAALLYLAGQKQVMVFDQRASDVIEHGEREATAGNVRSITRTAVYRASMRTDRMLLANELTVQIPSAQLILDGRSESEYWGAAIRAVRGGHIPGAVHLPLAENDTAAILQLDQFDQTSRRAVVYAHDNVSSLSYFARLTAAGLSAQVLLGGWLVWAFDSALAVDAESYPVSRIPVAPRSVQSASRETRIPSILAGAAGGALTGLLTFLLYHRLCTSKRRVV